MGEVPSSIEEALRAALPDGWRLREETDHDLPFLLSLYASTRQDELSAVPWSDAQKADFLSQQFHLQRQHYRRHYAEAGFWLLERDGQPAGRLYVHGSATELRLMDIALLPACRGAGVGTALIEALQAMARGSCRYIGLHVEPNNPALRLYRRLGFTRVEERGAYCFLQWSPAQSPLS